MDHILYQIFKIILSISSKYETVTDIPPIRIYVNKIENKIISKVKIGNYLELSMPKTLKLFGSTKNKINKDKSNQIVPHL